MTKTRCDLCDSPANPNNFGSLCDPCEAKRQARLQRSRVILRAHGQENTEFGRAIRA